MVVLPSVPVTPTTRSLRRMAIEGGGQRGQGLPAVRHHDGREAPLLHDGPPLVGPVGLYDHGDGAARHRLADVVVAVGAEAGHGHEQGARPDATRIVADGGDVRVRAEGSAADSSATS